MKKILNRYASLVVILLLALSCSLKETESLENALPAGEELVFQASVEENADAKTVLQSGGAVYWKANESINLFYGANCSAKFVSRNTSPAATADFSGSLKDFSYNSSDKFYAVYPYNENNTCNGSSVTVTLPSKQNAVAGTFADNLFISIAQSSGLTLSFKNLCGGVKFKLSQSGITRVVFKGNNNEVLAGKVRASYNNGTPQVSSVLEAAREITLTAPDGQAFAADTWYYMVCLPTALSNGFTMSFFRNDLKQGSATYTSSVNILRSVFGMLSNPDAHVSEWTDVPGGTDSGLYVGIIGFNQDLYRYPVRLLNVDSKEGFDAFVDGLSVDKYTLLNYSTTEALNALQECILPEDLFSVSLVTFTDGLDQGSAALIPDYPGADEYLNQIHSRILSETVAGQKLTAYSVGLRGSDVADVTRFRSTLGSLASSPGNAFEVSSMSEVNTRFQEIANQLNETSYEQTLSLTIPTPDNGTRIRFTLDNTSSASSSILYIEGVFNLSSRSLYDVVYHGVTSASGSVVAGQAQGLVGVQFTFERLQIDGNVLISKDDIRQWSYISSTGNWQINSEFSAGENADIIRKKRSAVVLLNMDCSSSLSSEFSSLQSHVRSFIDKLCQATIDPTLVTGVTLSKSSMSLTVGQTSTLTATVLPTTATDKSVSWSSSNTNVATVGSNGLVTAKAAGTAVITVRTVDGGKTATCTVAVTETLSTVDLSSSASANSYVVSSAGAYTFKTVKGNSSTSVGSVSKAEVLWESFGTSTAPSKGDIISSVSYSSNYIIFTTPSTLKNGNAVIAAKDASGNILWSWHIWVCGGYNPASTAQTYYNSAGKMMDRNLGATSASVGNAGSLGLLYQWGRKDPFLGSSSISSNSRAASTLSWPSTVSSNSSNGTIAYAVAHPTTFITYNSSNYDWYYTGSSSTDNTRWQTSKTIYDPCPPGWKVPSGGSGGVWSKATGVTSGYFSYTWDSTNKGMNFSGKFGSASPIWYPAAGFLGDGAGSLRNVGLSGYCWSCTPSDYYAYFLYLGSGGNVTPSGGDRRAYGQSVRCLQE